MSQIKEQMPTLIMGGSLLMYGLIAKSGALLPMAKYLQTHKTMDLQVTMTLIVGIIAIVGALINTTRKSGTTNIDTFILRPLGGIVLILVMAMAIRWYAEPLMKLISKGLQPALGFKIYKVLNLNYVVLGILAGVVLTNTWGIPKFAGEGVKCARFVLKMGVIMLGARYSFAEIGRASCRERVCLYV